MPKLQRLYPRALPHGHTFWILIEKSNVAHPHLKPLFSVTVSHGRVAAFGFDIQAEGD